MTGTMNLNGVEYELVPVNQDGMWQIIVCHRGFVFVGRVTDEDGEVVIRDSSNIRRWGTSKGLGELAANGPFENTILDPSGTVRVHPLAIVCRIDCEVSKWES